MSELKRVRLRDLIPGQKLGEDIIVSGTKLAVKNTIVTTSLVEKLAKWVEKSNDCVFIAAENESPPNASNCTSKELDEKTIQEISELYEVEWENFGEVYLNVKDCMKQVVREITPDTKLGYEIDSLTRNINGLRTPHSYRTVKLGIILTYLYNGTVPPEQRIDPLNVAMASTVHDIGKDFEGNMEVVRKSKLDKEVIKILNLNPNLLDEPYQPRFQSVYGFVALKGKASEAVRKIVLYSGQLTRNTDRIDRYSPEVNAAEIIFLCHAYDKLLELVIQTDVEMPLENVLTTMDQMMMMGYVSGEKYGLFRDNLILYAPGTRVVLSTGEEATVLETVKNYPALPTVSTGEKVIALHETKNITITQFILNGGSVDSQTEEIMDSQCQGIICP